MDDGLLTGLSLIDFRKAFDLVDHGVLRPRFLQLIFKFLYAPWDAPSTAPHSELNIIPFQERVAKLKAKMVFKALNGLLPSYIAEKFLRFSAVHARETRTAKEI